MLNSHVQLMATALHRADIEHVHHHRRFYWTVPLEEKGARLAVTVTSSIKIYSAPFKSKSLRVGDFVQYGSVLWSLPRLSMPCS